MLREIGRRICCIVSEILDHAFSWSPTGLGTSSILGGAIMAAMWRVAGQLHSKDSLIHAVSPLVCLLVLVVVGGLFVVCLF